MTDVKFRRKVEYAIVEKVIECCIDAGYHVKAFYDLGCDEEATNKTQDLEKLMGEMFATDEQAIEVWVKDADTRLGWVQFVYGNDGFDVIHDHTTNLDETIKPACLLASKLEEGHYRLEVD